MNLNSYTNITVLHVMRYAIKTHLLNTHNVTFDCGVQNLKHLGLHYNMMLDNKYSLKLLRTKIFVDFGVFEAPMKILSLKISYP